MGVDGDIGGSSGKRRVAVIGAGISGMSAAWLLSRSVEVVLYEASERPGGHANTVSAPSRGGPVPVDMGFVVYDERNYPNLVALFDHLEVATRPSKMSFAASLDSGAFEYSGSGIWGLLAQPANALRPRFWRIVADILRFYRDAPVALASEQLAGKTLGEYLDENGYTQAFVTDHLLPIGAAIWSTTTNRIRHYPLHAFIRFCSNQGLIGRADRVRWRTVTGGSREYIRKMMADFRGELRLRCPVRAISTDTGTVCITDARGNVDTFTDVVIATHADQALAMLANPDQRQRDLLGAIGYVVNKAVLHTDKNLMPRRRNVWSSWNYIGESGSSGERHLCVSYWMNRLQGIDSATPLFVTLNPYPEIPDERIIKEIDYDHPVFDQGSLAAQKALWRRQGREGIWFCGAHFGSGFHEDGLQSGLAVAEAIASIKRPWTVKDESGRLPTRLALMGADQS